MSTEPDTSLERCDKCGRYGWHATARCPERTVHPVTCAAWCTDGDGHPNALFPADQTCFGADVYVTLSQEQVVREHGEDYPARIGATPHRRPNVAPDVVYVHLDLPGRDIDTNAKLTAAEARALATLLLVAADTIDPPSCSSYLRE